jgi:hypothetical protein
MTAFHVGQVDFGRRRAFLYGALTLSGFFSSAVSAQAVDPNDPKTILRLADEIRFPTQGFEVNVRIRSVEILLMKGRDLWLFVPNVSQPVRLSLAQRLTGVVSNGDIARANFGGDYNATLLGVEKLGEEPHFVLDLTAVDRGVTYPRVKYWVRQKGNAPARAEFYSLSDRLLKTCTYEDYRSLGGRVRPTRLVMTDAVKADSRSVMEYDGMKLVELPDKVFTKEYLKKIQ